MFEFVEGIIQDELSVIAGAQKDQFVLCKEVGDRIRTDGHEALTGSYEKAFAVLRSLLLRDQGFDQLADILLGRAFRDLTLAKRAEFFQGRSQLFRLHRFQQVIDTVHLKRLQRKFVIRSCEDDRATDIDPGKDLEALSIGQFDVHQDQVG